MFSPPVYTYLQKKKKEGLPPDFPWSLTLHRGAGDCPVWLRIPGFQIASFPSNLDLVRPTGVHFATRKDARTSSIEMKTELAGETHGFEKKLPIEKTGRSDQG
jgi:hypothetical protein